MTFINRNYSAKSKKLCSMLLCFKSKIETQANGREMHCTVALT